MEERSETAVGYRYRLRVSPSQALRLSAVFDARRFVWNMALGRWNDLWRYEGLRFSYGDMAAELTDWRQTFDWLGSMPCIPQQQALRDLHNAIEAFFGKTSGRPKYKKRGASATARWTTEGFRILGSRLHVAVGGGRIPLRVVWSRPLPSVPKSVTVYRDAAGRWWATFVVRVQAEPIGLTGQTTGIDLGLTTYATTEFPDADVRNPRYGRAAAKALARSQRNLARKNPGSNSRVKARRSTARTFAKVANQRSNFASQEARKLARRFDRIGIEDLPIKNMTTKTAGRCRVGVNRSISDAAWGQFVTALEWQAKKCGHEVVRLHAYNTTQNCSGCGTKAKVHVGLADRTFKCSECGLVLDRDRNAARNLNPGWAVPGAPVDGSKTSGRARPRAARGTESVGASPNRAANEHDATHA